MVKRCRKQPGYGNNNGKVEQGSPVGKVGQRLQKGCGEQFWFFFVMCVGNDCEKRFRNRTHFHVEPSPVRWESQGQPVGSKE